MRNTCPLLSLHLIILEYVSDPFKTEVINHDNAAKFTGLSCKLHIFAYWNCTRNNCQSYRTTAHTLFIISAIYFLLRMHFVDFSRNCFGSFLAKWRRSWWDQSWEACLECHCDTFDTYRCMHSLRKRQMSICIRSMVRCSVFLITVQLMDMSKGLVLQWGEDRNHSFVKNLTANRTNGNDVALITPTFDFPKTWRSGFCTRHLQESIIQRCMTMVMQTKYQLKAEELLLASI